MNNKNKIITFHHKNDNFKDMFNLNFFALQVGKSICNIDLEINSDDIGDNISFKNKSFCELTGIYWAWKNLNPNYDYIGFMHYRRIFSPNFFFLQRIINMKDYYLKVLKSMFFEFKEDLFLVNTVKVYNNNDLIVNMKSINNFIDKELAKYDVVLPKKISYKYLSLEQQYARFHDSSDFDKFNLLIKSKYPEFGVHLRKVSSCKKFYAYNMFIMKREIFDDYCKKLFAILFDLEGIISIDSKSDYQKRVFGFIGERFLNVYIDYLKGKRDLKIKELNVLSLKELEI